MGRDLYLTLLDYATAMAGIEDTKYNSTQAFEMAAQNILVYVERVVKEAEMS
jgi:acyl CoA:acetate/3-ketoacid CoA transferase alpha subunit